MIDSRLLYIIHVLLNYELRMRRIKASSVVRSTGPMLNYWVVSVAALQFAFIFYLGPVAWCVAQG